MGRAGYGDGVGRVSVKSHRCTAHVPEKDQALLPVHSSPNRDLIVLIAHVHHHQVGPTDGSAVQKEYDFVFDDAIDFIKSGIIGGEGDFETAEIAKEKEVKVGLIMWEGHGGGGR